MYDSEYDTLPILFKTGTILHNVEEYKIYDHCLHPNHLKNKKPAKWTSLLNALHVAPDIARKIKLLFNCKSNINF